MKVEYTGHNESYILIMTVGNASRTNVLSTMKAGNQSTCNTLKKARIHCLECADIFSDEELLRHHINKNHNQCMKYACENCSETFISSLKFRTHCQNHGITHPFKCIDCDKRYTNENAMKVHYRSHINHRPYQCHHCDRSFSQSSTLSSHVQRHSGKTPYTCDVCEKAFATKGDLRTHNRIHKADKQLSCEICNKTFPRKSNLTRHIRKHTGEKPYACAYCSKRFARSENCQEHQRTHTNERPYTCEECGASFSDSGNFCNHKKIHGEARIPRKRAAIKKNASNACVLKIEPFRINLIRQPFQHHALEKFKSAIGKHSPLPIAYLSTSSRDGLEGASKSLCEDESVSPSLATMPGDELISRPEGNNDICIEEGHERLIVDSDIFPSLAELPVPAPVPAPDNWCDEQAHLMLDSTSCQLHLPFPCDSSHVVQNPSLHSAQLNHYYGNLLSTSLTSTNLIFADNYIRNGGNVSKIHNTMGDNFSLDINKFLDNDYFLDVDVSQKKSNEISSLMCMEV